MTKNLYRNHVTKILQSQGESTIDLTEEFWANLQKASGISENITEDEVIEECFKMMRAAALKEGCPPNLIEEDLRVYPKSFVTLQLLQKLEERHFFKFVETYLNANSGSEFFTTKQKLLWEIFIDMDRTKEDLRKVGVRV